MLKNIENNLNEAKISNLTERFQLISTIILLVPIFFNRISFGAYDAYTKENSINLPFHNFEPFLIIILAFLYHFKLKINDIKKIKILFFLLPIFIIQIFYFIIYHLEPISGLTINYLSRFLRAYIYIGSVAIYAVIFFNTSVFNKVLIYFLRFIACACFISYIANVLFGSKILLHAQGDYFRTQGFFSEPSATAAPLSALLIISIFQKNKLFIIVTICSIFFTKSPTAFLTLIISLFIFLLTNKKYRFLTLLFSSGLIFIVYLFLFFTDMGELTQVLYNSDSSFTSSLGRLVSGLDDIKSGGESGTNSRFQGTQQLITDMDTYKLFFTGYGFNASSEFFHSRYGDVKDYALQYSILFSYGIVGVIIFYLLLLISYIKLYLNDYYSFLLFTPFIVCSFINSAQGLVMYQITFLCLFAFLFKKNKQVKKVNVLNVKN